MNKETVKKNLEHFFYSMGIFRRDETVYNKACEVLKESEARVAGARSFLRKSISNHEVYIANIDGKDYKITPHNEKEHDIKIEKIDIIK